MKKFFILIISALLALTLVGCAEEKYPPVESTEEEAQVVMTLTVDGSKYEVKYELYRALFLNNKTRIDGGHPEVWSSDNAQQYIDEINAVILERLTEIYSVIHLSEEIGFDPFSEEADLRIEEYITGAVEGDENQLGHGSYDAYLDSLKSDNLNYSAAVLMLRYSMANEAIEKYYKGEYDEVFGQQDGEFEYTKSEVEDYYYSSDCARILQAYFQTGVKTSAQMAEYRSKLLSFEDEKSLASYIIGSTMTTESDLIKDGEVSGIILGKDEISGSEYSPYIQGIFELESGEMSPVILLENTNADGYYVIYSLEKDADHFEKFYTSIRNSYLDNISGRVLKNIASAMSESASCTEAYSSVVHSAISME